MTSRSVADTNALGHTLSTPAADVTVDATAGGVVLLAANTSRRKLIITNTGAEPIRVAIGTDPATTTGFQLTTKEKLEFEHPFCPTGEVKAIKEGATNSTAFALEFE